MFRSPVVADPPTPHDVDPPEQLVPLSVLELDLPAPVEGWPTFLAARGVEIVLDDLGRASVARSDARRLFTERREVEARSREMAAEIERQAVEADRVRRAQIWTGAPAVDGVPAATLMLQANKDAQPKRMSVLQESLAGEGMTYHALSSTPDEDWVVATAAADVLPRPLAVTAPVVADFAAMSLIVRRPEDAGGYEKLLWREAHQALVKAEESGWSTTPTLWGSAPGNYQFVRAAPGPNLCLLFGFVVGTAAAKVYAELVGRPGLFAFVTADKSARHFLGVTFRNKPQWIRELAAALLEASHYASPRPIFKPFPSSLHSDWRPKPPRQASTGDCADQHVRGSCGPCSGSWGSGNQVWGWAGVAGIAWCQRMAVASVVVAVGCIACDTPG